MLARNYRLIYAATIIMALASPTLADPSATEDCPSCGLTAVAPPDAGNLTEEQIAELNAATRRANFRKEDEALLARLEVEALLKPEPGDRQTIHTRDTAIETLERVVRARKMDQDLLDRAQQILTRAIELRKDLELAAIGRDFRRIGGAVEAAREYKTLKLLVAELQAAARPHASDENVRKAAIAILDRMLAVSVEKDSRAETKLLRLDCAQTILGAKSTFDPENDTLYNSFKATQLDYFDFASQSHPDHYKAIRRDAIKAFDELRDRACFGNKLPICVSSGVWTRSGHADAFRDFYSKAQPTTYGPLSLQAFDLQAQQARGNRAMPTSPNKPNQVVR